MLLNELRPEAGRVKVGRTVAPAYLSQQIAELDPTQRVLEAVESVAKRVTVGKGREQTAGQLLETLGFRSDRQWTPVGDLSGGERRRVQLLRLLMASPNVLLLDEPTNDLDIETLTQLEDLLDGWAGTLIVVSHDRWFLERVCDDLWALPGDGTVRHLPGGVDDYLAMRADAAASAPAASPRRSGDSRQARKELARIERRLEKITASEAKLHDDLALHASDHEKVLVLDIELRELLAERADLEEQWLLLADEVDQS
jgi:ATP-binding cassette subfamily F protein uup